ncbi:TPA: methyltransferase [Candidatus Bathyarchaeota archaeon]|nr:methyltransferase [Candidatus Bathyarchaeota archaeon]HIJ08856.1 methyltransferase [Candidatus Bathyarchaeota archaeon]
MGKSAQKRLVRRLDLELFLSKLAPHPSPQASLEQYTISEDAAATLLYISAYARNDIIGKTVLDLACGTGRLALGAAFLGAKEVVGADSDRVAIKVACKNSEIAGLQDQVQWVTCDLEAIAGKFETVLQNPPFGVQKRAADRKFIEKALEVGNSIYSFHNHPTVDKHLAMLLKKSGESLIQVPPSSFLESLVEKHGGIIKAVYALPMTIPKMFGFHTQSKRQIIVDLYVIQKKI